MPTSKPHITVEQAAAANALVGVSDGQVTCATALAAERSDGAWNLYLYDVSGPDCSRPWVRIPPRTDRTVILEAPEAGAVWAGIHGMYIGDREPIVWDE